MRDMYFNLSYRDFKALEAQCREFNETVHGKGTDHYHNSFRVVLGDDLTIEFHGPLVKARQVVDEGEPVMPGSPKPDKDICNHSNTTYAERMNGEIAKVCRDCGETVK